MTAFEDALDKADQPPGRSEPASKGEFVTTADGGEFKNVVVDAPISTDWTPVFKLFKKDPASFEIVDDTVRESTWQQSKRLENGERDTVQLYSYSARFKRRVQGALTEADIAEHRAAVRAWKLPKRVKPVDGVPCAAVINLADVQGGKSEGGGVAATRQRLLDGLENVVRWLERCKVAGRNINEIVVVNNGDALEGCAGNYAAQLFTVELNHRGQLNFVLDMWEMYARELFPRFPRGQFVSVLSNHGEAGRFGSGKNQTSDSDSYDAFLAETLRRVLSSRPEFDHIQWTIPHDEMTVYPVVAGVPMGMAHGHKIPGNDATGFTKWVDGQVRGDPQAHAARVWITAHRHHLQVFDIGSAMVFQAPSLDGGSKWFRDTTGKFSRSGILAMLVGNHDPLGVSDWAFL